MSEISCGIVPVVYFENTPKFLIVKHQVGHWGFPKGHVEMGEQYLQTAKREFFEEVGLNNVVIFDDIMFEESYLFEKNNRRISKKVIYFMGFFHKDDISKISICNDELCEYKICDFKECINTLTFQGAKDIATQANVQLKKI